jgi:hypothetical protein
VLTTQPAGQDYFLMNCNFLVFFRLGIFTDGVVATRKIVKYPNESEEQRQHLRAFIPASVLHHQKNDMLHATCTCTCINLWGIFLILVFEMVQFFIFADSVKEDKYEVPTANGSTTGHNDSQYPYDHDANSIPMASKSLSPDSQVAHGDSLGKDAHTPNPKTCTPHPKTCTSHPTFVVHCVA